MIQVDRSKVKQEWRDSPFKDGLEEFLTKVAMAKPLAKFSVSDKGIEAVRYREGDDIKLKHEVFRIRVFQDGERLGSISIQKRWRNGQSEECYGVEGFRVAKTRGSRNLTTTSDLKKAMSVVKKLFVPRVDDELVSLIKSNVTNAIRSLHNSAMNTLRWDFNVEGEIAFYAMQAYYARKQGEAKCYMPAKPQSIRDITAHDKKCDEFEHANELKNMMEAKQGYGVKANADNSLVVFNFATDTVKKYESFNELPEDIQEKYAVFKVLKANEPVSHIGCMFADGYAFVTK